MEEVLGPWGEPPPELGGEAKEGEGETEEGGREARRAPLRPLDEPRRCAQRRRRLGLPLHVGGTLAAGHRLGERSKGGHDE